MKKLNDWTKSEFLELPKRGWNEDIGEFDSLVILPIAELHDSGFRKMYFAAVRGEEPFALLGGCSDVIHLDGIGGYGPRPSFDLKLVAPKGWCIDCLQKSSLLRLFTDKKLNAGLDLSSFEVYSQ